MSHDIKERPCGECSACCTTHEIPEIQKPAGSICPNLCGDGCAVHKTAKPRSCRKFYCYWLTQREEKRLAHERPDRIGVVCNWETWFTSHFGMRTLVVWEIFPGAFEREEVKGLIDRLHRSMLKPGAIILRRTPAEGIVVDELHLPPEGVPHEEYRALSKRYLETNPRSTEERRRAS